MPNKSDIVDVDPSKLAELRVRVEHAEVPYLDVPNPDETLNPHIYDLLSTGLN